VKTGQQWTLAHNLLWLSDNSPDLHHPVYICSVTLLSVTYHTHTYSSKMSIWNFENCRLCLLITLEELCGQWRLLITLSKQQTINIVAVLNSSIPKRPDPDSWSCSSFTVIQCPAAVCSKFQYRQLTPGILGRNSTHLNSYRPVAYLGGGHWAMPPYLEHKKILNKKWPIYQKIKEKIFWMGLSTLPRPILGGTDTLRCLEPHAFGACPPLHKILNMPLQRLILDLVLLTVNHLKT